MKTPDTTPWVPFLPSSLQNLTWRTHPLDGKLLLFERDTGLNVLLEGEETQHLRRIAPRTLLIAVTNACDLTCPFCYRDQTSRSLWRYDTLLEFCQAADEWGVLEVAFGGGEPLLFPRWAEFINELYATTRLAINFTTNGTHLTTDFLQAIQGHYGQIRLSLYENNRWADSVRLLVEHQARFGVNWLMTPDALPTFTDQFMQLFSLGVRDMLLLSYKGHDPRLHLQGEVLQRFGEQIAFLYHHWGHLVTFKLDACWGNTLLQVPRLWSDDDCGAGQTFLSITSDKHIKICSFQPTGVPIQTIADVRHFWQHYTRLAVPIGGCARLPKRGVQHETIDLATIQQ